MFSQLTGKREQLIIMWIKFRHLFFTAIRSPLKSTVCNRSCTTVRIYSLPFPSLFSALQLASRIPPPPLLQLWCRFLPVGPGARRKKREGEGFVVGGASFALQWEEGGRTALQSSSPSLMKQSGMDGMPDVREWMDGGEGGSVCACKEKIRSPPSLPVQGGGRGRQQRKNDHVAVLPSFESLFVVVGPPSPPPPVPMLVRFSAHSLPPEGRAAIGPVPPPFSRPHHSFYQPLLLPTPQKKNILPHRTGTDST